MALGRVSWTGNSSLQHNRQTTVSLPTHTHTDRVSTILSQVYNLPLTTSQQLYKHWRIRAAKTCQHFRLAACFRTSKQTAAYRTLRSVPNQDSLFSRLTVTCFAGCSKLDLYNCGSRDWAKDIHQHLSDGNCIISYRNKKNYTFYLTH